MPRTLFVSLAIALMGFASLRAADDQKYARALLDKAIQALGGAEQLSKLSGATWKSKGKISANNAEVAFSDDWSVKGLDKFRVDLSGDLNGQTIKLVFILNGAKGWIKGNEAKTTDIPKDVQAALKEGLHTGRLAQLLTALQDKSFELAPLGELKVGNRETVGIRIVHKEHREVSLFLDKKTGLPHKSEVRVVEMEGGQEVTYEFFYDEYKDFDGLKHFSKIVFKRDGVQFLEAELSDIKAANLDDGVFDKP